MSTGGVKVAGLSFTVLLGLLLVAYWKRRSNRKKTALPLIPPKNDWRQVGVVAELNLYPIKSCKGKSLKEAVVTSIGLQEVPKEGIWTLADRRMVIYRSDVSEMVSARTHHQMLQIMIEPLSNSELKLHYLDESIVFQLPSGDPNQNIKLWTEKVPVIDCGDSVANWLQNIIFNGKPNFRLGIWPGSKTRRDISHLEEKYSTIYPSMRSEFTGAYSDLSSYLLLNQSSINDLNKRVLTRAEEQAKDTPILATATNFRGNIIIKGPSPYEEDTFGWVRIGEHVVMRHFKPCTRCSLTTVNPTTSKKDPNLEPLATLKTYRHLDEERRKLDPSPAMGIYLGFVSITEMNNVIRVGDPIFIADDT